MEIMMQSDAFAQSSSYHLDEMSGDFRHSHYDYWIESIFEYTSQDHDYDVEKNICNTEHILPDDWRFGFQDAYGNAHGSNWTTHDGKTHFLYGEAFESEYKDESTVRGLPAEMWESKLPDGTKVQQHFIHPNFTMFSNKQVPILVEMERNGTVDGHEFMFTLRWDIFYMIDAFSRHELDSITGQDPFESSSFWSPKFADCDKGVTQTGLGGKPDSLKGKDVDTKLEIVDLLQKNVFGSHLRFDVMDNMTRMDYYDYEKSANMRIIELKKLQASFNINRDTRQCTITEIEDSIDWRKNRGPVEPDTIFGLPDGADYNQPTELRQNIYCDSWQETFDTVMKYGPAVGSTATCSSIYHYPGEWLQNQADVLRYNAEPGMLLGYENMCYNSTDTVYHQSVNNFDSRNDYFLPNEFDLTLCFADGEYGDIFDFYFTMKGPYNQLGGLQQNFGDAVRSQIQVDTGLYFQSRMQNFENDLFTDFEIEKPEIIIKFTLLPQVKSFITNEFIDLTNEDFLERIGPMINAGGLEVDFPDEHGDSMRFSSVPESLAISYDSGVTYEPQSNKTRIVVKITHEKGYGTAGMVMMSMIGMFGMIAVIVGGTYFRFKRTPVASNYDTLE